MDSYSFLGALFDFSFSEFVTPKMIRILYGIGLVLAVIGALAFIVGGFHRSTGIGVLFLILSPLIFLLYTIAVRIYLEILIVLFRIAGWVEKIAAKGQSATAGS
jgi:Domain of unknown function (DUF4282)